MPVVPVLWVGVWAVVEEGRSHCLLCHHGFHCGGAGLLYQCISLEVLHGQHVPGMMSTHQAMVDDLDLCPTLCSLVCSYDIMYTTWWWGIVHVSSRRDAVVEASGPSDGVVSDRSGSRNGWQSQVGEVRTV